MTLTSLDCCLDILTLIYCLAVHIFEFKIKEEKKNHFSFVTS